ncbi:MAG TPA: hypothetical protein DCO77_11965 [Nitrospiraceae bacterium]|nr:hypothetical protein [Nitrospiraceae bacterium]
MKKKFSIGISALALFVIFGLSAPAKSEAGLTISLDIPLPRLVIPAPPALVLIPGTYAYVAADIETELIFYRGYWYHPYGGRWYRAADYRGPWHFVVREGVPAVLWRLPGYHRHIHPGFRRHPHRVVMGKWRTWEREQSGIQSKRKPYYKKKYGRQPETRRHYRKKYDRHPETKRYYREQDIKHSTAKQRYRKSDDRHPESRQRYQEKRGFKDALRKDRGRDTMRAGRRLRSN